MLIVLGRDHLAFRISKFPNFLNANCSRPRSFSIQKSRKTEKHLEIARFIEDKPQKVGLP